MLRLLIPILALALGCGDDKSSTPPPFVPPTNDMNQDMPDPNNVEDMDEDQPEDDQGPSNNPGEECDTVTCEAGEKCVRGDCVPEASKLACDEVNELGELAMDQTHTLNGDTTGFVDTLSTTCGMAGAFNGAENAFSFTAAGSGTATMELTTDAAVNWLMEVRRGGCASAADVATCNTSERITFPVVEGQEYFLVVEPEVGFDKGAFEIELTFTESACAPFGSRTCAEGHVEECRASGAVTLNCPAGCEEGACLGDTCDSAIEVTGPGTYAGNITALDSIFNFEGEVSCGTTGNSGFRSTGQDLVLRVPGLTAGQVVTVDASSDAQDQVIAVLSTCDGAAPTCVGRNDLGDMLTWTVAEDGDYFFVIDTSTPSNGDYSFTVDIQ